MSNVAVSEENCVSVRSRIAKRLRLAVTLVVTLNLVMGFADRLQADEPYSAIVVFGDSLCDTGNSFAFNGIPPTGPDNFPYFAGRFSNGPIWIDQLQASMNLQDFQVLNFAFGGASVGTGLVPPPEGIFDTPSGTVVPTVGLQIETYLQVLQPGENQLFILWAGSNNLFRGELPFSTALHIESHVRTLADAGATEFLIPNAPPLGATPLVNDSFFDSLFANLLTIHFNYQLSRRLDALENELGITIHRLDTFGLTSLAVLFPRLLGFTNGKDDALQEILDGRISPAEGANYVFWDVIHPTAKAHDIIATFALIKLGLPLQ